MNRGFQQRQQLEAHLPPTQGEHLGDQDARPRGLKDLEQPCGTYGLPGLVDRLAFAVHEAGKLLVQAFERRQLNKARAPDVETRHEQAAGDERHPQSGHVEGPDDGRRAAQMADPQQVLDIEQNVGGSGHGRRFRFKRVTLGRPFDVSRNTWAQPQSSLSGGSRRRSQPVARA